MFISEISEMASNIRINLLRNKPKFTVNLGENNYRVYTPGEPITEQKDFMRLKSFFFPVVGD